MTDPTLIVVADPHADDGAKDEMVSVIRAALQREFPERHFRFFSSDDSDLTLRNITSY